MRTLTSTLLLTALLSGCVNGIPPPDGWDPPKVKECYKRINGKCYDREEYERWVRQNLPTPPLVPSR